MSNNSGGITLYQLGQLYKKSRISPERYYSMLQYYGVTKTKKLTMLQAKDLVIKLKKIIRGV